MEKNIKVLIIDDDPNFRKTLSDILRAKGYESESAGEGAAGLALLKTVPFNVVLIDIGLPDMQGMEILSRVKEEWPSTEAIILTGNASLDSAIEATNRGAFSYLQKPYAIDQLLLQVRRAIEKQQAGEKIFRYNAELERTNRELRSLYEISVAITRTTNLDELFTEVLRVMAGIEVFGCMEKGIIFLSDTKRLRLAYSLGVSEARSSECRSIVTGQCLCGLAAEKGDVVFSRDSGNDERHTIPPRDDGTSHGHIIVPLKSPKRLLGVLCLYTRTGIEPSDRLLGSLVSIGNQIGLAIENAKLYEQAKTESYHDSLTGLANRRLLEIQMGKCVESVKRYGRPLSVIMIDIDHFKQYNDAYGHAEGDRLLAMTADILQREVRTADHVFRYGGEEFLVLLPETDLQSARLVAERLRHAIEKSAGVTISLGVSSYEDSSGESLINRADSAMYRAKQQGRNRVEVSL